nr:SagB/ThcOx family dehydrogenase [Candidatus Sigynarchaeota archaeon]
MDSDEYGDAFFQGTKYTRGDLPQRSPDFIVKPDDFKVYEDAERMSLPRQFTFGPNDLKHVLEERRSRRRFSKEPMSLAELSTLLKYTSGISGDETDQGNFALRHVPSAGGLYPYETYVVVNNVDGVKNGLYHYYPPDHALDVLKLGGDYGKKVAAICLDQPMAKDCAAAFLWTLVSLRSKWKYGQRAYRYMFIDLGHLAQNLYLVAEALQLSTCAIGALYDDEGNEFLGVDGYDEALCYVGVVGRRVE